MTLAKDPRLTMSAEGSGPYRFAPRERRGLIAGVRSGQVLVVTSALICAVVTLRSGRGADHGLLALLLVVIGVSIAWLPIRGRTPEEWLPVLTRHGAGRIAGTNRVISEPSDQARRRPVAWLSALEVLDPSPEQAGPSFGVVRDRSFGTMSAVLLLAGEGFALFSKQEQEQRLQAWANVLASLANSQGLLHRLQWIERTVPDHGEEIRRRIELALARAPVSQAQRDAQLSYQGLVQRETRTALRHESCLVVTISLDHGASRARRGERATRELSTAKALGNELALVQRRCREAGIAVDGALSADGLRAMLRRSSADVPIGARVSWPWPLAWQESWSFLRTDGSWHATYWILEWPRSDVPGDFLRPLLLGNHDRQSVSVVMAPISQQRATHAAEHARTSSVADHALRARHGFALTARSRREHEGVLRRESELAEGHGAYRFSGYVTVSAANLEELEGSCSRIEQAAALSRLELRRLYGKQGEAFCCSLPLGRGRT